METITFDDHGLMAGDTIHFFHGKKRWYVRLFHFITFKKFEGPELIYTITSVDSDTSITFCTGEYD